MNPKVTIVIPVYNGSQYMREAIDSALAQSYENIEVIVVNDGSTDDSEAIALSYGDRIRYFSKENGGVSTALNLGIAQMTGEYFQYLPHDDLLHPDKIKLQIEAIQKSGDEMTIAWSGVNFLREPEHQLTRIEISPWHAKFNWTKRDYPIWLGFVNTVTVLMNHKYFDQVGLFDPALYTSQDYDMWYRIFPMRDSVYIDKPLVNYRVHAAQGTQADKNFEQNCENLAFGKLEKITDAHIDSLFPSHFKFFYELLKYYQETEWKKPFQYARSRFLHLEEPEEGSRRRESFASQLRNDGRQLVLYGAGRNGMRLKKELWMHGIEIDAFCDGDPAKVGTEIGGVPCIEKDQLSDSCTVLISIDHPEQVRQELLNRGLARVMDYREVTEQLWTACPVKERVLSVL